MADENLTNRPGGSGELPPDDREMMRELIELSRAVLEKENSGKEPRKKQDRTSRYGTNFDIIDLFYYLLSKVKVILLCAAAAGIAMLIYVFFTTVPLYSATSRLYVLNKTEEGVTQASLTMGTQLKWDYEQLLMTWEVREKVIEQVGALEGLPDNASSFEKLGATVQISASESSRFVNITATSKIPRRASDVANAYAEVGRDYITDIMKVEAPNIATKARVPNRASNKNRFARGIFMGLVMGAALAVFLLAVFFMMDDKIKTQEEITDLLGIPVLAVLPSDKTFGGGSSKKRAKKGGGKK